MYGTKNKLYKHLQNSCNKIRNSKATVNKAISSKATLPSRLIVNGNAISPAPTSPRIKIAERNAMPSYSNEEDDPCNKSKSDKVAACNMTSPRVTPLQTTIAGCNAISRSSRDESNLVSNGCNETVDVSDAVKDTATGYGVQEQQYVTVIT